MSPTAPSIDGTWSIRPAALRAEGSGIAGFGRKRKIPVRPKGVVEREPTSGVGHLAAVPLPNEDLDIVVEHRPIGRCVAFSRDIDHAIAGEVANALGATGGAA